MKRTMIAPIVALAACALCAGSPSFAGGIDKSGRPEVALTVKGQIDQTCQLGNVPSKALGDLTQPQLSADADMPLTCNVPFQIVLTSQNGGLRNVAHPNGLGPYAGLRPYHLTLAMPVRSPNEQTITAAYTAAELVTGQSVSSQGGVAFEPIHFHLDLDSLTSPGLAAGNYAETIDVAISPKA